MDDLDRTVRLDHESAHLPRHLGSGFGNAPCTELSHDDDPTGGSVGGRAALATAVSVAAMGRRLDRCRDCGFDDAPQGRD
jgi:hypothetical protein